MLQSEPGSTSNTTSVKPVSTTRQRYEQLLQKPEIRSLLNTIRYAEGTPGEAGYQTMFGGGKFDTSKGWKHPDKVISSGGYNSAAAGAYQFLPGTWQGAQKALGLSGFDPKSQDLAALHLIERRGALEPFLKGEKFGTVINKLAPEWASLPTSGGGSYYGQPSKQLGDLYKYYEQQKQQVAGQGPSAPQQQTPSQPLQQSPLTPNINIIVTGKGQSAEPSPIDFLMRFMRGANAKQDQSFVPSPLELAKNLTDVESVNYFG